jgi:MoaA/NifB/PqqE/SkfB family radical SAM enzyme
VLYGWERLTKQEEDLIACGIMDGDVYGGPYHLALFPTDRCNLNCFFCYTDTLRQVAKELDWPTLERALKDGVKAGVKGVSFGGGGEALLYRELSRIFDFIAEYALTVDSIKTNGTTLSEDVARRLIAAQLRSITISLNETAPEDYGRMGQCSPRLFERAMQGLDNIVQAKRQANSDCRIGVQVFVWKENHRRLLEMVETLLKTGADFVYVNTIDQLPPEQRLDAAEQEELKETIRELTRRWADKLELNFSAEGLQQFAAEEQYQHHPAAIELPEMCRTPGRIEYCYMPWFAAVIAANGDVYPCCHFATDASRQLGSLHRQSLPEIWQGAAAQKCRQEMRNLLLAAGDASLLPAASRFVHPLCLGRTSCAFNYYLCRPEFYHRLHEWAESGPRRRWQQKARLKRKIASFWRKCKSLGKKVTGE